MRTFDRPTIFGNSKTDDVPGDIGAARGKSFESTGKSITLRSPPLEPNEFNSPRRLGFHLDAVPEVRAPTTERALLRHGERGSGKNAGRVEAAEGEYDGGKAECVFVRGALGARHLCG